MRPRHFSDCTDTEARQGTVEDADDGCNGNRSRKGLRAGTGTGGQNERDRQRRADPALVAAGIS